MPSLSPNPGFEYYFYAVRKGDPEAKAITVNESPFAALAAASEITGLPRDNFEIHEISKEEFEGLPVPSPGTVIYPEAGWYAVDGKSQAIGLVCVSNDHRHFVQAISSHID